MHHLPTGAQFAAMLASNQTQVAQGRAAGALPDYPTFVNNLFKELPLLNLATVAGVIKEMAVTPEGATSYVDVNTLLSRLADMGSSPDGSAMHAAVGCAGEGGEMLDCVKKVFIYGKDWNAVDKKTQQTALENLLEEMGDFRFYYQKLLNMLGITDADVQAANYVKLAERYASGKYSDVQALARADKDAPTPRNWIGKPVAADNPGRRAEDKA